MSTADAIKDLYDRRARDWDADRGRDLFETPWLEKFASLLPPGGRVLDIGCGSGDPIARYFINSGYDVTGIDSATNMIALCREKFPGGKWVMADMRDFNLDKDFDGILVWHSLIHIRPEDQAAIFPLIRKHAQNGSALMFTSGTEHGEQVGEWRGEPLYHGSLSADEYRRLLEDSGFELADHVSDDPGCGGATVWLARAV